MQNLQKCWPAAALLLLTATSAQAQGTVYKCPGTPVLYTDQLTNQQARDRGCTTIEGTPITIISSPPRPAKAPSVASAASAASGARPQDGRIDPADQRSRDNDARRILADELKREEERLAALQKDFNNGEPERKGDERNYQRYMDRVAEMKAAITRKEADIAALKREMSKLQP
jgi:hypothetical protein